MRGGKAQREAQFAKAPGALLFGPRARTHVSGPVRGGQAPQPWNRPPLAAWLWAKRRHGRWCLPCPCVTAGRSSPDWAKWCVFHGHPPVPRWMQPTAPPCAPGVVPTPRAMERGRQGQENGAASRWRRGIAATSSLHPGNENSAAPVAVARARTTLMPNEEALGPEGSANGFWPSRRHKPDRAQPS